MFQIGDKVVCINSTGWKSLTVGKTYIIDNIVILDGYEYVYINRIEYRFSRFISVEENRRLKIEKICSKLVIK